MVVATSSLAASISSESSKKALEKVSRLPQRLRERAAADSDLGVDGCVDHLGDVVAVDGGEDGGEADAADTIEDDVEGHIDLGVLAVELLRGDIVAAAGSDDDADSLIDGVDALEDVVGAAAVGVAIHGGDAEDVDGVDEMVDDDLATGGGKGVVAEGGVQVVRGGVRPDGGGLLLVGGCGEGEAVLPEGSEGGEGSSWGGTTRASGGGRRHRWTSLHQKQGRARMPMPASWPRQLPWRCTSGSSAVIVHGWAFPITVSQLQEHLPCRARGVASIRREGMTIDPGKVQSNEDREEKRERKKGRRDRIEKRRKGRRRGALLKDETLIIQDKTTDGRRRTKFEFEYRGFLFFRKGGKSNRRREIRIRRGKKKKR